MSRPVIAMFDDFFASPEDTFHLVTSQKFTDFRSPWDLITYPKIAADLPPLFRAIIKYRLENMLDCRVSLSACFSRLMTEGMTAPHRIHSDKIMGQYSMHIYLSKDWPADGGTAFWSHETEGAKHTHETDVNVIARDYHDMTKWTRNFLVLGKYNRAVIHDASLFHSAEPAHGWGSKATDGRLVLTTFFSEISKAGGK